MRTCDFPFTCVLVLLASNAAAAIRYVSLDSATPTPPYASWATAARTIQDAVDAADPGDHILVTNGVYRTGGRTVDGLLTNRLVVTKPLVVSSVNGPLVTIIEGYQIPGAILGRSAVRCVYLGDGASLSGFTLTRGATLRMWGSPPVEDTQGGGVRCQTTSVVSNCILTNNSAFDGGGAWGGQLNNCALNDNAAEQFGGGAANGTLSQCTVTANSAGEGGGTAYSTLNNSIVYYNYAPVGSNYLQSTFNYSCTAPLPASGANNISINPELASAYHLSPASPCRGLGNAAFASGFDIDGEAWINPPSIGCDEYHAGAVVGPLEPRIAASFTNVVPGIPVDFRSQIAGHCSDSRWELDDGTTVSNRLLLTRSWAAPGNYQVALRAYNETHPAGVTAVITIFVRETPVQYVAQDSANPIPPYLSWATAATNIQDAVDVGFVTGTILVSNGVYQTGGRDVKALTNRVVLDKQLTLRSINGPTVTSIVGNPMTGDAAVRCVYMADGTTLEGFTLTQGATLNSGSWFEDWSGGGLWCESTNASVSNCVLIANSAADRGGGAFQGTLNRCLIQGNSADFGGGAAGSILNQCLLATNSAYWVGGGAYSSTLDRCTLVGNSASTGGGTSGCVVNNSVIFGNNASYGSGACYASTLNNCTVANNAGGAAVSTLHNCIVYYNNSPTGYNYRDSSLNYCCTTPAPDGTGNITNAPLFVDLAGGNLRLQSNSPCLNAGNIAYVSGDADFDGRPRVAGGAVDIGAYEFQSSNLNAFLSWLQNHSLPTDGSADSTDTDGDRMNNWQEWRADTSPTNALSVLRMLAPTVAASGIVVSWESVASRAYFIERGSSLEIQTPFMILVTNLPGMVGTTTYTDTNASGPGPYFYRVGVSE
jgi:hypothetical protein